MGHLSHERDSLFRGSIDGAQSVTVHHPMGAILWPRWPWTEHVRA
jgi:hypothetical protein